MPFSLAYWAHAVIWSAPPPPTSRKAPSSSTISRHTCTACLRVELVVAEDDPHVAAEQRVGGALGEELPVDVLADVEARLRDRRGAGDRGVDADHDLGVGHAGGVVVARLVGPDRRRLRGRRGRARSRSPARSSPSSPSGVVESPASVVGGCGRFGRRGVRRARARLVARVTPRPTRRRPTSARTRRQPPSGKSSGMRRRPAVLDRVRECVIRRPSARCCRRGSGSRPVTRYATAADRRAARRNGRSRRRAAARRG